MMLEGEEVGGREKKLFFSVLSLSGGRTCIALQEGKLINRLGVIFYQQELDSSS